MSKRADRRRRQNKTSRAEAVFDVTKLSLSAQLARRFASHDRMTKCFTERARQPKCPSCKLYERCKRQAVRERQPESTE